DKNVFGKKVADENDFKQKVAANAEWQREYGKAWDDIASATAKETALEPQLLFHRTDSTLAGFAGALVTYATEIKKPDADRLPGYHDAQLESLKFRMASPAPVYPGLEIARMSGSLQEAL